MKTRVATALGITALAAISALAVFSKDLRWIMSPRPGSETTAAADQNPLPVETEAPAEMPDGVQTATFGSGCFWCTEAVFQRLEGVESVVSGYSGGRVKNPTYHQVCLGSTGHAEVIQVTYDSETISYAELLEVFWKLHDPTTLNRQGGDRGTQYRSVIFYHTDQQRRLAEYYKRKLDASGAYTGPIVTEIAPFSAFYPAEDYHQNYFEEHGSEPYCRAVILPKMDKLKGAFGAKLKTRPAVDSDESN